MLTYLYGKAMELRQKLGAMFTKTVVYESHMETLGKIKSPEEQDVEDMVQALVDDAG